MIEIFIQGFSMLSDPFMVNMTQEDVEMLDTAPAVFLSAL